MSSKWDAWVKENNFERRMPLSAFLKLLPNWALQEMIKSDDGLPIIATHAALIHESLWQEGDFILFQDHVPQVMVVAAILEGQRRCGLIRFSVEGDDRLLNNTLTIELNPAVMGLIGSNEAHSLIEKSVDELSEEEIIFENRVLELAMASDWCDRAALEAP